MQNCDFQGIPAPRAGGQTGSGRLHNVLSAQRDSVHVVLIPRFMELRRHYILFVEHNHVLNGAEKTILFSE